MKGEEIQRIIDGGYQIIRSGAPAEATVNLWEYLDQQDEKEDVLVLPNLLME